MNKQKFIAEIDKLSTELYENTCDSCKHAYGYDFICQLNLCQTCKAKETYEKLNNILDKESEPT